MVKATKSGSFKPVALPEPQSTVARCYSLIDIGTVRNVFKGKDQGTHHRIFLTWELPGLKAVFNEQKGEEPFVISEEFTLSTKDNSNLAKLISAWRGAPLTTKEQESFDPTVMVEKSCLLQFIHKRKADYANTPIEELGEITNGNTNLKIMGIVKRPKSMELPAQINPTMIWDWEAIEDGEEAFDKEKWDKIPAFIRKKMVTSEQYAKLAPKDLDSDSDSGSAETGSEPEQQDTGPVTEEDW
jgi:hypothetical protein